MDATASSEEWDKDPVEPAVAQQAVNHFKNSKDSEIAKHWHACSVFANVESAVLKYIRDTGLVGSHLAELDHLERTLLKPILDTPVADLKAAIAAALPWMKRLWTLRSTSSTRFQQMYRKRFLALVDKMEQYMFGAKRITTFAYWDAILTVSKVTGEPKNFPHRSLSQAVVERTWLQASSVCVCVA